MNIKKGQIKQIVIISAICLFFSIIVFANIYKEPTLATIINGKSINTADVQNYIEWYNNFDDVNFEKIDVVGKVDSMKVGNSNHELKGYIINNKKYAVELVVCDEKTEGCFFKINGISTEKIYLSDSKKSPKLFSLNNDYDLRINNIVYDFCDHKRFCDAFFEAYDIVDIEVVEK